MRFVIAVVVVLVILAIFKVLFASLWVAPMYIIHLERAKSRAQNIRLQMKKMSHDVNVFPAVDGTTLDTSTVSNDYDVNHAWTRGSTGEVACYLSHVQLLRHIKKTHPYEPYAIIFEDDFSVAPNFSTKVADVLRTLKEDNVDFDILYLGNLTFYQGEPVNTRAKVTKICKNGKPCWGLQGYVVNIRSIPKILSNIRNMSEAVDGAYQTAAVRGDIVALVLDKTLVTQEGDTESFIRTVPYHHLIDTPKNSDN